MQVRSNTVRNSTGYIRITDGTIPMEFLNVLTPKYAYRSGRNYEDISYMIKYFVFQTHNGAEGPIICEVYYIIGEEGVSTSNKSLTCFTGHLSQSH